MNNHMPFTFIHTADWCIGHPFPGFDESTRKKLKRAIFSTVEMIFLTAQKEGIPLILCAGNMVDDGQLCARENLHKLFSVIKKYPAIRVVMVAGNRDPLINRNIYTLTGKSEYPENLHLVEGEEELDYPEWNVNLLAASFREKNSGYHPLKKIKEKRADEDKINIGLCHAPAEENSALTHGLDYLALGGESSFKKINPCTYFPGSPQPLQFDRDGFPLKVTVPAPGAAPVVESLKNINQYKWRKLEETIDSQSLQDFKIKLESTGEREIRKLSVSGFLPIDNFKFYRELLDINRSRFTSIIDNVAIQPEDSARPTWTEGYMAEVVNRLMELKKTPESLPEEIFNPYVSIEKNRVHQQASGLKDNPQKIIDNALLKIYSYVMENSQ